MGFGKFYSKILGEYIKYGQIKTYTTPGTLEFDAMKYQYYFMNKNRK